MASCSPQIASGPLADLGYQEEVCFGQLPAVPNMKTVRRRSTTLALTKDSYDSEEVRSDRMVSDSRHGIRRAGGDIVTEISPGAHADFYEALVGGQWVSVPTTAQSATVCTDADDGIVLLTAVGDLVTLGYLVGDIVMFTSTTEAEFDGKIFQIVSIPSSSTATVVPLDRTFDYADLPTTLSAGTMTAQPRTGMDNIYRSFLMERAFTDIGSFITFNGLRMASAALDLPPTGIATSTFSTMGKDASAISAVSYDGVSEIVFDDSTLTSLTFDGAAQTITAAAGVLTGIAVGDRILFDGAGITDGQNRNPRTVTDVSGLVITVAEAIQTGGAYTSPFTVTRVGLPAYTVAPDEDVLVAVSGAVLYKGQRAGTITSASFTIDNQMAGSEVVGANTIPINLFGNQCLVNGSITVLFDRGGIGEQIYNAFDAEEDDIQIMLTMVTSDATGAVSFVFPRCKISTGSIGDAVAEGIPVDAEFRALKPAAALPQLGTSQINIIDTAA